MRGQAGSGGAHNDAGRAPCPTWRANSACTSARSSGWVTPMQRPVAGRTVNGYEASERATTSGRSTSASSEAPVAASMAAFRRPWKAGVNPHRFIDTRASGDSVGGLPPVGHREATVGKRRDLASLVHFEQLALGADLADTAGDRRMADHGVRQAEPHQRIGRVRARQVGGQEGAGGPPVDVVRVPDAIGRVTDVLRRAQHSVDGAERRLLQGEADVDK